MLTFILPITLGVFGWVIAKFLGDPLRRFFDLKGEVARQMIVFGNVPARVSPMIRFKEDLVDSRFDMPNSKLELAKEKFRDLAAQAKGFEQSEVLATWALKRAGYDPGEISRSLIGLSNSLDEYGQQRADAGAAVRSSLKLDDA